MYWKEAYKIRTKASYDGYDTIYNNEPRLNFHELLDHMEAFTQVYCACKDDPPAIRTICSAAVQTSSRWA